MQPACWLVFTLEPPTTHVLRRYFAQLHRRNFAEPNPQARFADKIAHRKQPRRFHVLHRRNFAESDSPARFPDKIAHRNQPRRIYFLHRRNSAEPNPHPDRRRQGEALPKPTISTIPAPVLTRRQTKPVLQIQPLRRVITGEPTKPTPRKINLL